MQALPTGLRGANSAQPLNSGLGVETVLSEPINLILTVQYRRLTRIFRDCFLCYLVINYSLEIILCCEGLFIY